VVIGDVALLQVHPTVVDVAAPYNGATTRTAAAIAVTATTTTNDRTTKPSIPHYHLVNQTGVTPSLPPFPATNEPAMSPNNTVPQMIIHRIRIYQVCQGMMFAY
jgi:hypothetical protein